MGSNFLKLIALTVIALVVMSGSSIAQDSKFENELISKEKQSWEAWQKRDGKFFANFLSDDHVEVGSSGLAGKDAIVSFVGSPMCKVESYKVDKFKVVFFRRDLAVVNYFAEQDTTCNGEKVPSPAWASSVYIKRKGRWFNALYQQSAATKQ